MTSPCPPQIDAYRDLSRIFGNRNGRVLEFEILPPAFGPFLEDDCSIGVTKKYLVQAFVTARKVFFDGLKHCAYNRALSLPDLPAQWAVNDELDKTIAIASEVILLFDCEHLTACNWRKRRLTALANSSQGQFVQALDAELSLMTAYLCSPLHRHTKSPTLWQHRRWIQTHLIHLRKPDFQAAQDLLATELSAALRAGERHPRNYYAFSYMRQIHRVISDAGGVETQDWSARLGQAIISTMLEWCLSHPTDISGLMFLLYLLDAVPDASFRMDTIGKVARFALDIGWEGESLWTFVDLAVRRVRVVASVDGLQTEPWNILLVSGSSDQHNHDSRKTRPRWKTWLERAQTYWAHTQQSTNNPPQLT
ncbi:hypothetical protein BJX68DRAFT_135902 [Aspergillus pseudodeflectus]|uniref:Uncharacterized protein n=1 Tax=Aspergillus pseudodeflectus TaxID=176178 RepID=A0ABR4JZA2_9EURO